MERLKVLIIVKTYPIPSKKYDELVCTAGVSEDRRFVRLYPINFRNLDYPQKYKKYQWIEVEAEKHRGRDSRKESWRPNCDTLKVIQKPIPTKRGNWDERAEFVLPLLSRSIEELNDKKRQDKTSLGIIKPKQILGLNIAQDTPDWPPKFLAELSQQRLWETRGTTKEPPRKVPWKFRYHFCCDDPRCGGSHRMMIVDWEAGALYWREIDNGKPPRQAAKSVRNKFLHQMCSPKNDTYLFVGTVLGHGTWVVIGVFYPKRKGPELPLWNMES